MYAVSFKETSDGFTIKAHSANTQELAEAISADILERFGVEGTITHTDGPPTYDPGGMILASEPITDLGLICSRSSHLGELRGHLRQLLDHPPRESVGESYYKIHGQYNAVCLSVAEAYTIYSLIND